MRSNIIYSGFRAKNGMQELPFIILASQSPRRQKLLREQGYPLDIIPSQAEELDATSENVAEIVVENARRKGREVIERLRPHFGNYTDPTVLLASDTLVAMGQRVFPKPRDLEEAHSFLETLGGHEHQVYTGVFLYHLQTHRELGFYDRTDVTLHALDRAQRDAMFQRVNPLDKAGAYGSQDAPEILAHLRGHLSTVIGLPTELLRHRLHEFLNTTG